MTRPRAALVLLLVACAGPMTARAFDMQPTVQTVEQLLADGFRVAAAVGIGGTGLPIVLLDRPGASDVYACFPQFRNCSRLVDSPSNPPLPGGAPFPPLAPR